MRPYSLDLREPIVAAVDRHEGSLRWIARIFRVSTSFLIRLLQRRRATGTLDPKPHAGGPLPALSPDDHQRLADLIREQPDATVAELKQKGGFTCSLIAVQRQAFTLWFPPEQGQAMRLESEGFEYLLMPMERPGEASQREASMATDLPPHHEHEEPPAAEAKGT